LPRLKRQHKLSIYPDGFNLSVPPKVDKRQKLKAAQIIRQAKRRRI